MEKEFTLIIYKELDEISKLSAGIRRLGSAALDLAYVSSGKIDGFWEKDLNLWDVSAGVLLSKRSWRTCNF